MKRIALMYVVLLAVLTVAVVAATFTIIPDQPRTRSLTRPEYCSMIADRYNGTNPDYDSLGWCRWIEADGEQVAAYIGT